MASRGQPEPWRAPMAKPPAVALLWPSRSRGAPMALLWPAVALRAPMVLRAPMLRAPILWRSGGRGQPWRSYGAPMPSRGQPKPAEASRLQLTRPDEGES